MLVPPPALGILLGVASAATGDPGPTCEADGRGCSELAAEHLVVRMSANAERSMLVFEAAVVEARSVEPAGLDLPMTYFTLVVADVYQGELPPEVELVLPGGLSADGTMVQVVGMPKLRVGDEAVVFAQRFSSDGAVIPIGGPANVLLRGTDGSTLLANRSVAIDSTIHTMPMAEAQAAGAQISAVRAEGDGTEVAEVETRTPVLWSETTRLLRTRVSTEVTP